MKYLGDDSVTADPFHDEYIFMRWKELFLVPDHKLVEVRGASYSGFYYVCMRVKTGSLEGYYYHNNSDPYFAKFSSLILTRF